MSQKLDVLKLARDLIAIESVSHQSNIPIAEFLEETMRRCAFEVERLEYLDGNGQRKVNLVGKKGNGTDGLGFLSHCDTVPGSKWDHDPLSPDVRDGRLIGLGSCDMKGPLAAALVAGADVEPSRLRKPLFIVITADEENASLGARHLVGASVLFRTAPPKHGVITEPTRLIPVYSHKGAALVTVTALGRAAHTSTEDGISSNFLIAPFLAEMAELARLVKTDPSYFNHEFHPPTLGFNMVIDDGGCRPNVTASKTACTLCFRPMPNDRSKDVLAMISDKAEEHGFEFSSWRLGPFSVSPEAEIVQAALTASGLQKPETVSFCTDAPIFQDYLQLVILGPGDISQAHTVGEWIAVNQLSESVNVYKRMIEMLCMV